MVNLLVPFVLLLFLNYRTYNQIKEFEQRLASPQLNVSFHRRVQNNPPRSIEEVERPSAIVDKTSSCSTLAEEKIATEVVDENSDLQEELKSFFDNARNNQNRKCERNNFMLIHDESLWHKLKTSRVHNFNMLPRCIYTFVLHLEVSKALTIHYT